MMENNQSNTNSEDDSSGGGRLFLCNPSPSNDTSFSSQSNYDSSVDHIDTREQVFLPGQRQPERDQIQSPLCATGAFQIRAPISSRHDCIKRDEGKEPRLPKATTETAEYGPVVGVKPTKGDHWKLTDRATARPRSMFSSKSPSESRRRRTSGNRSEERKPKGGKESSDDNLNSPNLQARGREQQKRKERAEPEHSRDGLHRMIRNLETRFSAVEDVIKELREVMHNSVLSRATVEKNPSGKAEIEDQNQVGHEFAVDTEHNQEQKLHTNQEAREVCSQTSPSLTPGRRRLVAEPKLQSWGKQQKQHDHHHYECHQYGSSQFAVSQSSTEGNKKVIRDPGASNFEVLENLKDNGNSQQRDKQEGKSKKITNQVPQQPDIYRQPQYVEEITAPGLHQSQNDLSIDRSPMVHAAWLKKESSNIRTESDSSNSSEALKVKQATGLSERNISEETKYVQECLQQVLAANVKMEQMSERLDQTLKRMEMTYADHTSNESREQTELKTPYSVPRIDQSQDMSNMSSEQLMSAIRETVHFSVDASLRMQSIWTETQINGIQEHVTTMGQNILRVQNASTAAIVEKIGTAQRQQQQQFQTERSNFDRKLVNFEENLADSKVKTEELIEAFRTKIAKIEKCVSTEMNKKIENLSQGTASHADTMRNLFLELDDRFTRTLEDFNESLNNHRLETKQNAQALYSGLKTKLDHSLETLLTEITAAFQRNQGMYHTDVEEIKTRMEVNVRDTLEVIAGRLDKTKHEVFSVVEKESQLVRDLINEPPTRDGCGNNHMKMHVFDFYIDKFEQRMTAAANNHANGMANIVDGIIPNLDTSVHSCSWYIPHPVDTSFLGFVNFTDARTIKVYLLFGRNPNEVGLKPRIGRAMTCSVIVADLSGNLDEIELNMFSSSSNHHGQGVNSTKGASIQSRSWDENEIKTNEKMGLFLGTVSCDDIIGRRLNTPYADGTVLLRYSVSVA